MHWITGLPDDPNDLCAHGSIEFRIGNEVLLDSISGKDLTVSAAALYLLRTLAVPRTRDVPVGDRLFPHCGFAMLDIPGNEEFVIQGCNIGVDFEVLHSADGAGVVVGAADGRQWQIGWSEWRSTVFAFADRVLDFFADSSPKRSSDEHAIAGFKKFKTEWKHRRGIEFGGKCCEKEPGAL
jgi:hypothetical protein